MKEEERRNGPNKASEESLYILENSKAIRKLNWKQGISSKVWENVNVELHTQWNYQKWKQSKKNYRKKSLFKKTCLPTIKNIFQQWENAYF